MKHRYKILCFGQPTFIRGGCIVRFCYTKEEAQEEANNYINRYKNCKFNNPRDFKVVIEKCV